MSTDLIVGLILPLFAGFFNSSWNLPTKLKLPTSVVPEFAWENFWFLYTFGSIISVIVYTSFVIPFSDLFNVLSPPSTPTSSLVLMIVFSLCWGVGTVLFGLSVLLVGMGMGLTMALAIAILLGTIYPLFLPNLAGNPDTGTTWCLVLFGILIMMGGIFGLGRAGGLQKKGREVLEYELSSTAGDDDDDEDAEQQQQQQQQQPEKVDPPTFGSELKENQKFTLCLGAGFGSSFMQWVFLCGENTTDATKLLANIPSFAESAPIWFLAFLVSGAFNMILAAIIMKKNNTFNRLDPSIPGNGKRYFCSLMSGLVWSSHVYIYGISANLVGPVVAFPLVMISTMCMSQFWGVGLGKWTRGEPGWAVNVKSFCMLCIAIVLFSVAGALDEER